MMLAKKKVMVDEALKRKEEEIVSPKKVIKNSKSEQIFNQKLKEKLALLFKALDS